jgi:hypothetical protein
MLALLTRRLLLAIILPAISLSAAPSALGAHHLHRERSRSVHRRHVHRKHHKTYKRSGKKAYRKSGRKAHRISVKGAQTGAFDLALTPILLGSNVVQSQQDYLSAGQAEAFSLHATASGTAGAIHLYIDTHNRAGTVIVGLYSNAGKRPGSLLSTGTGVATAAGTWTTVAVAPTQLTAEAVYWLAILGKGGTLRFRDYGHGPCPSQTSAQTRLGGLPASWSSGANYTDCPASAYVSPLSTVEPPALEPPASSPPPAESPAPPPPPAPTNVSLPSISGTAIEGETLIAGTGEWLGSPTSFAYQWQDCDTAGANCTAIAGATTPTYALTSGDVTHTIRVLVTASNVGGLGSALSPASAPVAARVLAAPTNTAMPAITGTTTQGQVVSASSGSWTGSPTSYSYQWRDCDSSGHSCTSIGGATEPDYTLASSDVNHTMRVMVTASNTGGSSSMSSPATATVQAPAPEAPTNLTAPIISGAAIEGETLSATAGTWTGSPSAYAYQWQDCDGSGAGCANIPGATAAGLTLTAGDVQHTVRVIVTATNAGGSTPATSAASATIAAATPPPPPPPAAPTNTTPPAIGGSAVEGQTLTASTGTWTGSPTSFAYQWQDCDSAGEACTSASGATGSSYTLGSGDVGRTVRVVVTAANAGGSTSAVSGQVGVVIVASSGGAGCTVTVSSLSVVNGDLTPGAVVCLSAGSYGSLTLTASPSSNATLTAAPGAHVVVGGVQIAGKHLTVSQLHSTGGIEVKSGGGSDVIDHNDVTDPKGYGISVLCSQGCSASDTISNVMISGNEVHETSSTGEGDALRFDGWSNITVKENDIYNIRECPGNTCHTDTLQSYQAGIATSGLALERNYIHDCVNAQGFPFLKDGDVSNVTISDNLALRMSSGNEVTGMFIDDNSVGLSIANNTYQGTSGSIVQSEGSASQPTLALDHNVFDTFNVPAGKYAVTEDYDIFTANNEWTFGLGPHSVKISNPGFVNPSADDYRLASNPNHIGIDWSPSTQQYGPSS